MNFYSSCVDIPNRFTSPGKKNTSYKQLYVFLHDFMCIIDVKLVDDSLNRMRFEHHSYFFRLHCDNAVNNK